MSSMPRIPKFALLMPVALAALSCNQFPPISGEEAAEANDVIYYLQDFLKAQQGGEAVSILGRGGNHFVSIYIYGAPTAQMRQKLINATQQYVNNFPLLKDVHLVFYEKKLQDGRDGALQYSRVVQKYKGRWFFSWH